MFHNKSPFIKSFKSFYCEGASQEMLYFQQQTPETAESEHEGTVLAEDRFLLRVSAACLGAGGSARLREKVRIAGCGSAQVRSSVPLDENQGITEVTTVGFLRVL